MTERWKCQFHRTHYAYQPCVKYRNPNINIEGKKKKKKEKKGRKQNKIHGRYLRIEVSYLQFFLLASDHL